MPDPPIQYVGSPPKRINRNLHLWRRLADGTYRCVSCGGMAQTPTVNDVCDRYEPLNDDDRALARTEPVPFAKGG